MWWLSELFIRQGSSTFCFSFSFSFLQTMFVTGIYGIFQTWPPSLISLFSGNGCWSVFSPSISFTQFFFPRIACCSPPNISMGYCILLAGYAYELILSCTHKASPRAKSAASSSVSSSSPGRSDLTSASLFIALAAYTLFLASKTVIRNAQWHSDFTYVSEGKSKKEKIES